MKKEYLFAGISIVFWGSTAAVSTLMMNTLSSMAIVFYNSLVAFLFLLAVLVVTRRLPLLRALRFRQVCALSVLGLLGMFAVCVFLYYGLAHLKAQQAYIINYLWPILIVVFSWLILGQKMTARKCIALILSFFGVVIVATEGSLAGLARVDVGGVAACMAAACCYALFSVFNMRVQCDKFVAMFLYYGATTAASLLCLLVQGPVPALTATQWSGILWLGVLTNGLAYTTWALAMDRGDTAKLSNLAYLTPFLSLVYIFFLLHEPIRMSSYLGLVFILSGVLLQVGKFSFRRPRTAHT